MKTLRALAGVALATTGVVAVPATDANAATHTQVRAAMAKYCPGGAYAISTRFNHWGVTDLSNGFMYINANRIPSYAVNYVAVHECVHNRQARRYHTNWNTLMNKSRYYYGGSGILPLERMADCAAQSYGFGPRQYINSCTYKQRAIGVAMVKGYPISW